MLIRQDCGFEFGYNSITELNGKHNDTMMDFGILKLAKGQQYVCSQKKERAYLLIKGEVIFEWDGKIQKAVRESFLDENPWCLHVPSDTEVSIAGLSEESEISVTQTLNETFFQSKLYTNTDVRSENRGKGTMGETSTRIVRTIFDKSNAPWSNLVAGEVINYPGKWSSYPPHYHPQPEIYFYKFQPQQGFGIANLGENAYKVKNNDTVKIVKSETHPQIAAPGYAMYYIWVIRHLDGNPYITPVFEPEHLWVTENNANIWTGRDEA